MLNIKNGVEGALRDILNLKVPSAAISIAASATYDIKPPTGKKWTLLNLWAGVGVTAEMGVITISVYDGTTEVCQIPYVSMYMLPDLKPFYLTETHFLRITNTNKVNNVAAPIYISYEAHESDL